MAGPKSVYIPKNCRLRVCLEFRKVNGVSTLPRGNGAAFLEGIIGTLDQGERRNRISKHPFTILHFAFMQPAFQQMFNKSLSGTASHKVAAQRTTCLIWQKCPSYNTQPFLTRAILRNSPWWCVQGCFNTLESATEKQSQALLGQKILKQQIRDHEKNIVKVFVSCFKFCWTEFILCWHKWAVASVQKPFFGLTAGCNVRCTIL